MSKTDFFDDDLVKQRERAHRIKMGPGDSPAASDTPPSSKDIPSRPVSDLNLTRMAKHKEEVSSQVAHAMEELERLRGRQEALEREKHELEDLRRKQHEYEAGRREVVTHLNQSLVRLEKEEVRAEQLAEMLGAARTNFRSLLAEVESLNEEDWPEASIRQELDKALVRIDQVRVDYNKTMAKIDATLEDRSPAAAARQPLIQEDTPHMLADEKGFRHWFTVGFAASLPLIITLALIAVFVYLMQVGLL